MSFVKWLLFESIFGVASVGVAVFFVLGICIKKVVPKLPNAVPSSRWYSFYCCRIYISQHSKISIRKGIAISNRRKRLDQGYSE